MTDLEARYQNTLKYLYGQLPMFQRVGKAAFKKDLTNTLRLCHFLGHPHQRFSSIHIAGTNGKGSVSHMLAAILQEAGYRVGLYTSPHYLDFRERIKINGLFISKHDVCDFTDRVRPIIRQISPSFFELTVAMAFDHFCRQQVDIAVVETGLGGRLDSTNVLSPLLSLITNISFDHQEFLGNTLPLIAAEKAGIIKHKVPVLIGSDQDEIRHVFKDKAVAHNAPIHFAREICQVSMNRMHIDELHLTVQFENVDLPAYDFVLPAGGSYQVENANTSLAAIQLLDQYHDISCHKSQIRQGLANMVQSTAFMGRWQLLDRDPLVLVDSAHNEAGIRSVVNRLGDIDCENLHIVFGMVKGKVVDPILSLMPKDAVYYFCQADQPRALPVTQLIGEATKHGLMGSTHDSVTSAIDQALEKAGTQDLIFVGGSSFVAAEAIRKYRPEI